jgi:hypothetical protein
VLRHRVRGIHDIDEAVSTPPAGGRARIRGHVVARLAGARSAGISCAWDAVRDAIARRRLDLTSPFAGEEVWRDLPADQSAAIALVDHLARVVREPSSPAVTRAIRDLAERLSASGDEAVPGRSGEQAVQVNNHAFDLRNTGRLEEAEHLMRAALAIDLAVRPADHPKVPHRRNNLATVLLMQGRVAEAREQAAAAWLLQGTRYDLTSARILTIRLAIAFAGSEPCALFAGQLKAHLAMWPLPDFADVDRHWQMAPVLDRLAARIEDGAIGLLRAIVGVLNGSGSIGALEDWPLWRETPAQPLW